jgi:hypothetical protein
VDELFIVSFSEVGAGAFFALSRFCAREREAKKRARKREERKARKKRKRRARKKKSPNSRFLLPHNGNPVSEHTAEDRQSGLGSTGYVEQDWNNRTGRIGLPRQDLTARKGQDS